MKVFHSSWILFCHIIYSIYLSILFTELSVIVVFSYTFSPLFPGHLQDGRHGDEDARRRINAREADGQNLPSDGQES